MIDLHCSELDQRVLLQPHGLEDGNKRLKSFLCGVAWLELPVQLLILEELFEAM